MSKKSISDVLVPKEPKLDEFYFGECWVFSKDGDVSNTIAPFLVFPPANRLKSLATKCIEKDTFIVPEGYDPLSYMVDILQIDPLIIIHNKKDLDLTGLHRFGHAHYDHAKRTVTVRLMYNPNGTITSVGPTIEPLFILKDKRSDSLPKSWSFPVTEPWRTGAQHDINAIRETADLFEAPDWVACTTARCRDVDWQRTLSLPTFGESDPVSRSVGEMTYPKIMEGRIPLIRKWVLCPGWYIYDGILHSILPSPMRSLIKNNQLDELDAFLGKTLQMFGDTFFTDTVAEDLYVTSVHIEYHTHYAAEPNL